MKKIVFSGFMASVLMASSAAFADDNTTLTTKNYVDSGLREVYKVATGAENGAVKDLQTAVGDSTGGLVKDVADLKTAVGDSTDGLVKDVDDLKGTVGDSTDGLVKDVDDLKGTVGDSTNGLVKDVDDLQGDVTTLKTTVGDASSGLVKRVNDLEESSIVYTAGKGISVTPGANTGDPATISLNGAPSTNDGKTYIFKDGTLEELPIVNTWNASVLNAAP